jgi:hypothetical protein
VTETRARTPYCHKIRYGITGAPTLTEDEMDGSHAPGIGVAPTLIELAYSAARDGKPASVSASVTGSWTRFGKRADGQVTVHFKNDPDGWPVWLAEEARLHDPDAVPPAVDRAARRDRIARAILNAFSNIDGWDLADEHTKAVARAEADAVLAVLPAPADRADETPQPETEAHPPHHRWYVETLDDVAGEWAPGMRYTDRAEAAQRYQSVSASHPTWRDGKPVQRRFVRETTSYTVEPAPAVVAQPDGEADTCPAAHGALGRICELPKGHAGMHTGDGPNGGAVWQGDAS